VRKNLIGGGGVRSRESAFRKRVGVVYFENFHLRAGGVKKTCG
jgi:hypothetical protein